MKRLPHQFFVHTESDNRVLVSEAAPQTEQMLLSEYFASNVSQAEKEIAICTEEYKRINYRAQT